MNIKQRAIRGCRTQIRSDARRLEPNEKAKDKLAAVKICEDLIGLKLKTVVKASTKSKASVLCFIRSYQMLSAAEKVLSSFNHCAPCDSAVKSF